MQIISYQIKNYMRDHGSIGLPLGMGSFGGLFGFCVFLAFSFSVLVLREANKPPTHRILVGNQRERNTLGRVFLSFSCLLCDNSVLLRYCLVQRPFCIFLLFSSKI